MLFVVLNNFSDNNYIKTENYLHMKLIKDHKSLCEKTVKFVVSTRYNIYLMRLQCYFS